MKRQLLFVLLTLLLLSGCSDERLKDINPHQNFIATINILQPSLQFFNEVGDELARWDFEKAYSGGTLIQRDRVLMYGNQLLEADLYELSTGKLIETFPTEIGTTNGYYDTETNQFFIANSKTNTVTSYDSQGRQLKVAKLRNYPMSMAAYDGLLYVVNYKDTLLSVISIDTMTIINEWEIPKSSHGIRIFENRQEVWIGGHGEGNSPNEYVNVYDLETGKRMKQIKLPIMPVALASSGEEVAVISHGNSMLHILEEDGTIKKELQVGANPFSVAYFNGQIAVAGYDDHTLYFIENGQIVKSHKTAQGPFQLIVREDTK